MSEKNPHLHFLALLTAVLLCLSAIASPVLAQSGRPDVEPPIIELEEVVESFADRSQVFTAQVVDNLTLGKVTLHYRRNLSDPFVRINMTPLGSSGFFSATVNTEPADLRRFEYYVQALDDAGNRTVYGFAFDPLRRDILSRNNARIVGESANEGGRLAGSSGGDAAILAGTAGASGPPVPAVGSGRQKWWAIALGVVAVGAVAALAADDGGGSGGDTVPLRVQLQEP